MLGLERVGRLLELLDQPCFAKSSVPSVSPRSVLGIGATRNLGKFAAKCRTSVDAELVGATLVLA